MKRIVFFAVLMGCTFLQGCLPDDAPIPRRVNIRFNVDNIGNSINRSGNMVQVDEIKIFMEKFILSTDKEARLEANPPAILRYRVADGNSDAPVFAGNLGFDYSTFTGIEVFVDQPDPKDNIPDRDLVSEGERFSIFMQGTYNGETFEYQSKRIFTRSQDFTEITINAEEETLYIRLLSNVEDFIVDPSSAQILNPMESENSAKIDSLISESLTVEASAEASLPL